jgi:hypothetical protein
MVATTAVAQKTVTSLVLSLLAVIAPNPMAAK